MRKEAGMKAYHSIFFLLLVSISEIFAQTKLSNDSTIVLSGVQLHTGRILPHSESIEELTQDVLWGAQAEISRIRLTRRSWNTCNCYSQNGVSISYFNFNNPDELGAAFNAAVFAEPQLIHGKINLGLRAGAGISYLTRVYHPVDNPRNLFFSNPWSGLLLLQLSARYRMSPAWILRFGGAYHHISNGGQRRPNKGMNFPALSLGVEYASSDKPLIRRMTSIRADKRMHYYAGISYNTRSVDESDFSSRAREPVIGIHGGVYKPVARMHAFGAGIEFFHDNALKVRARRQGQAFDHRVLSGLVVHHLIFGRFDFSQALGFYLYKEYPTPSAVFQRYALRYLLLEKVQIGLSLKAHLHTAEQMDVRIGLLF